MAGNETRSDDVESEAGPKTPAPASLFVDALALFLRTVPIYADTHRRVTSVAARLAEVLEGTSGDLVLDVTAEGLSLDGVPIPAQSGHAKSVRDALDATAIARITFAKGAPIASFTFLARALGRNARLAANGTLTFEDLWSAAIAGIKVEEQVYDTDAFDGGAEAPDATRLSKGGGGGVRGPRGAPDEPKAEKPAADATADDADEKGDAPEAVEARTPSRAVMKRTVARELRDVVSSDETTGPLLARLESALLERENATPVEGRHDLLEQIMLILPIEARIDPAKGLAVVQKILERLASELIDGTPSGSGSGSERASLLIHAMRAVFPARSNPGVKSGPAETSLPAAPSAEPMADPAEELEFLKRISLPLPGETPRDPNAEPVGIPDFDADAGIKDLGGVLTQTLLAEVEPARREAARQKLIRHLMSPEGVSSASSVEHHLREAASAPAATRDLDRILLLASVLEAAGLSAGSAASAFLTPEILAAVFPRLLPTFLAEGGKAGVVARAVGRDAVLAAGTALRAPGGVLSGAYLDRVLKERSGDVLPFIEVLATCGDPAMVARAAKALRNIPLPTASGVVLSVLPEGRAKPELLAGLCQDGFTGVDSHRIDAQAVAAIASVVSGAERSPDVAARAYATAALSAFPRELVEPVLRWFVRRKWLIPLEPRAVRRNAQNILNRFPARRGAAPVVAAMPAPVESASEEPGK